MGMMGMMGMRIKGVFWLGMKCFEVIRRAGSFSSFLDDKICGNEIENELKLGIFRLFYGFENENEIVLG